MQPIFGHHSEIPQNISVMVYCTIGMQQYGLLPYCVLPLRVLQYIAVLQYMIKFEKRAHHVFKLVFSSKG